MRRNRRFFSFCPSLFPKRLRQRNFDRRLGLLRKGNPREDNFRPRYASVVRGGGGKGVIPGGGAGKGGVNLGGGERGEAQGEEEGRSSGRGGERVRLREGGGGSGRGGEGEAQGRGEGES